MKPPVSMEPSPSPAAQRRAQPGPLRVLVVAGEGSGGLLQSLRQWAPDLAIEVEAAPDLPRAVRQLAAQRWDIVLAVLGERADDDVTWWVEALRGAAGSPQLLTAAHRPSMGLVLRAEKLGVLDLLSLPARREDLQRALERVRAVATEVPLPLPEAEPHAVGPYALVGQSPAMLEVYKLMARVAQSSATVLVQGESGTGKEVIARAIHLNGAKASGPFVAVDCAAIPENLLESELFGHEKGAFTGAEARRIGAFEEVSGGTIFLDEIGELPPALQPRLLRVLENGEIRRVGSNTFRPVDVRVIAAPHRDLRAEVNAGRFRHDLYFRLAVLRIALPPLRRRPEDIPVLVEKMLSQIRAAPEAIAPLRAPEFLAGLSRAAWPGNVR